MYVTKEYQKPIRSSRCPKVTFLFFSDVRWKRKGPSRCLRDLTRSCEGDAGQLHQSQTDHEEPTCQNCWERHFYEQVTISYSSVYLTKYQVKCFKGKRRILLSKSGSGLIPSVGWVTWYAARLCRTHLQADIELFFNIELHIRKNLQVRFEFKARQIMKLQSTQKQKLPF